MNKPLLDTKLWQNFSQAMAHNENMKTLDAISKHLEMEDERLIACPSKCDISCQGK